MNTLSSASEAHQKSYLSAALKEPVLFQMARKNQAKFFLQFGGQAGLYLDELGRLYENYPHFRKVMEAAQELLVQESETKAAQATGFYNQGFRFLDWIQDPEKKPDNHYLASSYISQALIFITQVLNYQKVKVYGEVPDLLKYTKGIAGHSQGIMSACLVALNLSGEEFETMFLKVVKYFFWQGLRMQKLYPYFPLPKSLEQEAREQDWGKPTPMAAIAGIKTEDLQTYLDAINPFLKTNETLFISLVNGWKRVIVSGSPQGLVLLRRALDQNQRREERKAVKTFSFQFEFLNVAGPYHSPLMKEAQAEFAKKDLDKINLGWQAKDLKVPVFATNDGRNLQNSKDLMQDLLNMQYVQSVSWPDCLQNATSQNGVTHILDFGPGEMASALSFLNQEGQGVAVIPCAVSRGEEMVFSLDASHLPQRSRLWETYRPEVVKIGEKTVLKNRYTDFTGYAPIFGGGMTPTTVEVDICVAAANAGYNVEWAGGGQVTEEIFYKRFDEMKEKFQPGRATVFNALYLDAYLWNLQYPLLLKMKKQGYPIEGLTISAGIPSRDKAKEILKQLNDAGIWCNSFKPGSDSQIQAVLEIADDHPQYHIIMQIEGGKAGGHHSWEDLYALLENNYGKIRRRDNVILCVGGGIGLEEQATKFLLGTWHESGKIMPVDGVILGTRLMAAKEAKTSPQIKKLLMQTSGTQNWVMRHEFASGMTSGQSQLGADVHYADNQMARVADEIDQVSALKEEQIVKQKDRLIKLLNQTAKPYFGDVENMTYLQVLSRMIELMAPGKMPEHMIHDAPFFDKSYRLRVYDFVKRMQARLHSDCKGLDLSSANALNDSKAFLKKVEKVFSNDDDVLHPEDVDFFLSLCRRPGKPVNFVPVIDKNIKRWFKSDSLWQAHDPRYSAEQALTIPGPEAVKGIRKINEPVAEIFDGFQNHAIQALKKQNKATEIRELSFLGAKGVSTKDLRFVDITKAENEIAFTVSKSDLDINDAIANECGDWAHAVLQAPFLLQCQKRRNNFLPQLFSLTQDSQVKAKFTKGHLVSLQKFEAGQKSAVASLEKNNQKQIELKISHESADGKSLELKVVFDFVPEDTKVPLQIHANDFQKSLQNFYRQLWVGKQKASSQDFWEGFSSKVKIDPGFAEDFALITLDQTHDYKQGEVSLSLAIALFWEPLASVLLHEKLNIELLNLLHLSNEFEFVGEPLRVGDTVESFVRVASIEEQEAGRVVTAVGELKVQKELRVKLRSQFLIQNPEPSAVTLQKKTHANQKVFLTEVVDAYLKTQKWFKPTQKLTVGSTLEFVLHNETTLEKKKNQFKNTGEVFVAGKKVATVLFEDKNSKFKMSPVEFFLNEFVQEETEVVSQEDGFEIQETFFSPVDNSSYALVSKDLNPIHTDQQFAVLAELPNYEPIVHGMWTSAATLSHVQKHFSQIKSWKSNFVGMVRSSEALTTTITHQGSSSGDLVLQVKTTNASGQLVLQGEAKVAQKKTAYLFTGQGSQAKGMGMSAYQNSEIAREVWDRMDHFCQTKLGFSILKIVRDNPKTVLVDGKILSHPRGVLHLTQFTQVGLTVLAMAQTAELKAKGLFQYQDAVFAGHSLGEYAALACFDSLPQEEVLELVYHRGLTMQNFVPRDAEGRSPFAMVVVRPKAVEWKEKDLETAVQKLNQNKKGEAVYVVNYNIEGSQYSVTGHRTLIEKLEALLHERAEQLGVKKPACIWVEGVDVPFHSPLLENGVEAFRKTLQAKVKTIDASVLIDRYIPNLNAEPFSLEKEYLQAVFKQTQSPVLKMVLTNYNQQIKKPNELARTLLIELLAYQFASPVRWIQTQKNLLQNPTVLVERVIEFGPSSVLANMFKATLTRTQSFFIPEVLHFDSERDPVFYKQNTVEKVLEESSEEDAKTAEVIATPVASVVSSTSVAIPEDQDFDAAFALKVLLAQKLKIRFDEVRNQDTIEALSGGNSAKRNELLTDIAEEFAVGAMDDAHQMPIAELGQLLNNQCSYDKPGKLLKKSLDRALREKLSLDEKTLYQHLEKERVLPQGLQKRAALYLVLAVREGASNKSGALSDIGFAERITDKSQAKVWLDKMVDQFGKTFGFEVPHVSQLANTSGGAQVSEEALQAFEEKYFGPESPFAQFAKDLSKLYQVKGPADISIEDLEEKLKLLDLYQKSFGTQIEKVIEPKFESEKIIGLRSIWNWSRLNLVHGFWSHLKSGKTFSAEEVQILQNQISENTLNLCEYLAKIAQQHKQTQLADQLTKMSQSHVSPTLNYKPKLQSLKPRVSVMESGDIVYEELPRKNENNLADFVKAFTDKKGQSFPKEFTTSLESLRKTGLSFQNQVVLITGASPGSIAFEVLKNALRGGAKVIATTTSYHSKRMKAYREIYQNYGARDSELWVVPFNQGSKQDVESLVNWCFANNLVPDCVLPFGAIGEIATLTMMNPDSSTATLRVLLQGVQWLIGAIASQCKANLIQNSRTHFVLPLSPNHGVFGGDGAYADAKLGLESLLNKWVSEHEDWGRYVSLVGAEIGWVRGTGLMAANNVIAEAMEEKGVRTFSTEEMGLLLTATLAKPVVEKAQSTPIKISLTGGFEKLSNLDRLAHEAREALEKESQLKKALQEIQSKADEALLGLNSQNQIENSRKASLFSVFPNLKSPAPNAKLNLNPDDVIVVVGYGEVSPYGNSLPRFAAELGEITTEAAIEWAWLMGLIRYEDGTGKIKFQGWVDAASGEPVFDDQVFLKYGDRLLKNSGIRFTDVETQGFDPRQTLVFSDVTLTQDLTFTVDSKEQAQAYLHQNALAQYFENEDGEHFVILPKGSLIKVPKHIELSRFVAGQVPQGWDATRFGLSKELIDQIDRNTTYNLVSSAQAFLNAGLEPEELYDFIDPSLVANTQGGGMGGMTALARMYHDHREDKPRQADALQETLINVGPAWVSQSYLGAYGPMVHPVAACATSLVSMSAGLDLIGQNKADFAVVGGFDDYSEEGVIGFSDMQATCETKEMLAKGLEPQEMSRPNDSRRGGFVEAQGGGTLLIMRLSKALEMGLPVYAVVGFSNSYSDGVHTSIPAPGLGLLAMAKGGLKKSPLGQALQKFGLNADNITVVSKHDTSTAANDPNENRIHHLVQTELGRSPGNPLYVHSQKSKLGHAKGGAGAWQMIAAIQMLHSGKIPGNQNLEDVDTAMQEFDTLLFTDKTLNLGEEKIQSVLMTSLGFGHVGAATLLIHPQFVMKQIKAAQWKSYTEKRRQREQKHKKNYAKVLMDKQKLFVKRVERPEMTAEIAELLGHKKT